MAHLWHDLVHAFTHADKGFFHLFVALFKNPGKVAREYILEGKRKRYFAPLQYLIIVGAIATFVVVNTHYMENAAKMIDDMTGQSKSYSPRQEMFMHQVMVFQSKYYNFLIMLQLPFFALATFWIYKRRKLNFAEILTLQTFISAQATIFGIFLILLVTFAGANPMLIFSSMFVFQIAFQTITYMQFFREKTVGGFFKAIIAYLLGVVLFFVFAVLFGILLGAIIMIANT